MQGSCKDLTASRMSKDRFLQGSLLKCSSSPGTCIPCKLGSRPVGIHATQLQSATQPHALARKVMKKSDQGGNCGEGGEEENEDDYMSK